MLHFVFFKTCFFSELNQNITKNVKSINQAKTDDHQINYISDINQDFKKLNFDKQIKISRTLQIGYSSIQKNHEVKTLIEKIEDFFVYLKKICFELKIDFDILLRNELMNNTLNGKITIRDLLNTFIENIYLNIDSFYNKNDTINLEKIRNKRHLFILKELEIINFVIKKCKISTSNIFEVTSNAAIEIINSILKKEIFILCYFFDSKFQLCGFFDIESVNFNKNFSSGFNIEHSAINLNYLIEKINKAINYKENTNFGIETINLENKYLIDHLIFKIFKIDNFYETFLTNNLNKRLLIKKNSNPLQQYNKNFDCKIENIFKAIEDYVTLINIYKVEKKDAKSLLIIEIDFFDLCLEYFNNKKENNLQEQLRLLDNLIFKHSGILNIFFVIFEYNEENSKRFYHHQKENKVEKKLKNFYLYATKFINSIKNHFKISHIKFCSIQQKFFNHKERIYDIVELSKTIFTDFVIPEDYGENQAKYLIKLNC